MRNPMNATLIHTDHHWSDPGPGADGASTGLGLAAVGPEVAIAIASQVPTLEAAGFVQLALLRPPLWHPDTGSAFRC
jgi:hypothetical protein